MHQDQAQDQDQDPGRCVMCGGLMGPWVQAEHSEAAEWSWTKDRKVKLFGLRTTTCTKCGDDEVEVPRPAKLAEVLEAHPGVTALFFDRVTQRWCPQVA